MAPATNRAVFAESILPQGNPVLAGLARAFGMECVLLAVVVIIPMLMPHKFEAVTHYWVMPVEAPHIEAYKPQPVKPAPVVKVKREVVKEIPKPVEVPEVVAPKPKIYTPVFTAPVDKDRRPKKTDVAPDVQVAKAFPDPTPALSLGSSAPVTIKKPKEDVQTGGFGDPNSIPDNGKTNRNPNMAPPAAMTCPPGRNRQRTGGAKAPKA